MARIERLINLIIALLTTRRPLSAEEIRTQVAGYQDSGDDAFRRTFERDKEALRAMGVPLQVRKIDPLDEHSDGYLIPRDLYYLPQIDLEADELAALQLAAQALVGPQEDAEAGFLKLSLDSETAPVEGPRLVWGADPAAEGPLLPALYEAQLDRRPVRFTYESSEGTRSERVVEPYGLVNRRGHWYVVGRDQMRDALRSFRVSRIAGRVQVLSGGYEIPEGFDPDEHLPLEPWEVGESTARAVVRFDAPLGWWVEQNMGGAERTHNEDGSIDVTLGVANLDALVSWVIRFGADVEIIEPPEARSRLLELLEPLLGGT